MSKHLTNKVSLFSPTSEMQEWVSYSVAKAAAELFVPCLDWPLWQICWSEIIAFSSAVRVITILYAKP